MEYNSIVNMNDIDIKQKLYNKAKLHGFTNFNIDNPKTTNAYQAIIHAANTQPWDIYDYSGMLDIFNEIYDF